MPQMIRQNILHLNYNYNFSAYSLYIIILNKKNIIEKTSTKFIMNLNIVQLYP